MAWQRNDDQYGVSRKVTRLRRRTRLAAVGLDQLAKNYSARALTDGVLDATELEEVLATPALIAELVRVDMWHTHGHSCPKCVQPPKGGVVIHDYLDYNPSRVEVEAARERDRKRKGSKQDSVRNPSGIRADSAPPVPVPGPVPQTDSGDTHKPVTEVDVRVDESDEEFIRSEAARLRIGSWPRVRRAFEAAGVVGSDAELLDLARLILDASEGHVRWPERFIETACDSPDEVLEKWRGLPRPGKVA